MSKKAALLPKWSVSHLDMMRGIAAIAVAIFHVRGLMFVDFDSGRVEGKVAKLVYLLTGFGHQAVVVFFVLSGFFIGTSVMSSNAAGKWSWRSFLLNRFTRIYIVLVPALLLTLLWDNVGMHLFGADTNIYASKGNAPHGEFMDVRVTGGVGTLLGNLVHLQMIFTKPFGSNSPLWSLSLEWWMYILFALFLRAAAGRDGTDRLPIVRRLLLAVAGFAILGLAGKQLTLYFGVWLLGALVARIWHHIRLDNVWLRRAAITGMGGLFAMTLLIARLGKLGNQKVEDLVLGAGTAAFVLALLTAGASQTADASAKKSFYARTATWLASYSYTLYLVHFPPLVFLHAWKFQVTRWDPTPTHLAQGALVCAAVILLYGFPLSRVTEAHTEKARRWLQQKLFTRVSPSAAAEPALASAPTLPQTGTD